jgi:hypothetical protein
MIVIAGLAFGLALTIYTPMTFGGESAFYQVVVIDSVPVFLGATTALFVLRLRKPRPIFWRIARQPGMAASIAILCMFLINMPFALARSAAPVLMVLYPMVHDDDIFGAAVIFSWLTLYLTRAWKSERGWIDVSGRILGGIWIGVWAIDLCFMCVSSSRM